RFDAAHYLVPETCVRSKRIGDFRIIIQQLLQSSRLIEEPLLVYYRRSIIPRSKHITTHPAKQLPVGIEHTRVLLAQESAEIIEQHGLGFFSGMLTVKTRDYQRPFRR